MSQLLSLLVALTTLIVTGCVKTDQERAVADGATPLTKQEVLSEWVGNTQVGVIHQYSIEFAVYYSPDGRLSGAISGPVRDTARGTWRVTEDGQVCNEWNKETWKTDPSCHVYFRHGDELEVFLPKGGVASVSRITPGNSKRLELRSDFEVAQAAGGLERIAVTTLREQIPGNTLSGKLNGLGDANYHAFYSKQGKVAGTIPSASERDTGVYRITDDGEVCVTWTRWLAHEEHCGPWYQDGDAIKVFDAAGNLALTVTVREGNPEKI
ncbi:MAG: hypothetical protein WBG86_11080 [Polyangiales bacterium]